MAAGAVGLGIVDISHVSVSHAILKGDLPRAAEGCQWRTRPIKHAEVGVKRREMEGDIRARDSRPPSGSVLPARRRSRWLTGDQQGRQLEPDGGLVLEIKQRFEHRLERPWHRRRGRTAR